MKPMLIAAGLTVLVFGAGSLSGQSAQAMHSALKTEGERLEPLGSDRILIEAVKAQNARGVSLSEIQRIDKEWIAGRRAAVQKAVTTGPCADRLRELASQHAHYGEMFVSDGQGALVCANSVTSDYWQGDEDKWIRAFNGGAGAVYVDRPRFDESARGSLAQISVPIRDGGKAIGVITIGVVVGKLIEQKK